MENFELSPERAAGVRRAETLARKIKLLLDTIPNTSGKTFDYPTVSAAAQEKFDYYISRTRWSLLKAGKEQVVPEDCLRAIAGVFGVNPEYLLQEDGPVPEQVDAELTLLRSMRRAEVRNFAARTLGPVDPEALRAIAKILDEGL
ncbi:hypothetical protein [Arthrobacter sp. ES1]|uniref:hypothetical protein n=1 Tax=Arthrobacter sp. ES1 TaxID=1897056 RepID=UPI001CFFA385|nr:hypothetical protein [Arthrobacter sp. ES1]MCB5281118.1 hypothetical protein [Arthrobacter sp. ES1]